MKSTRCNNKIAVLGMVGALLLALCLTPFLPGTASAAEQVENTYALVVTTGSAVGDSVSYFGLQYVDADGYTHTEYVFPHKGALEETLEIASGFEDYNDLKALGRGQTDTFFFQPDYPVAQVTGLDVYCQGTQGSLYSWDVSGLRLYKVDQILGLEINGKGTCHTVCFNGTQIAHLEERSGNAGVTFSWTGNTVFRLREETPATHRLIFENIPYSMEADHRYVVRLDIADFYSSGLECMNQAYDQSVSLRDAALTECLALEIEYLDSFGDICSVKLPVMTAMLSWFMEQGISPDAKIAGLAQQGDTIACNCYLRDMQSVTAVTLYTGKEAQAIVPQTIGSAESASFTGVSIYRESQVSARLSTVENSANAPELTFAADPLFYHTAGSVYGEEVGADSSHYMTMRPYEAGAQLVPKQDTEKYLIQLKAKDTQITGVPDDLTVKLQYVDMAGETRESEVVSVRNAVREYYGYWPASTEDFAYVGQLNSQQGVCFVMELPEVEHFTGLYVCVPGGNTDWQIAGFQVIRLDTLGKRTCVWENVIAEGAMSNRRYTRDAEGYLIFSMNETALIQPGNSYEMDFVSQSVQEVQDIDWSDMRYAMTYEQCAANLGLAKVRENYVVEVQVQSGTTTLDSYGDNGSKNRFYFLLEFENGVSGYVLANQQLGADGFRSGCTESFTISTNYDYGELVAVHVIPDDVSEESDPYDKLNIDRICVRRGDNGSISREWVVENVGWIGIDYRDEGASASIGGQQGRTEADISRVYPVSYSSYALNIEFRMGTGTYTESGSGGSFYGTMEATLEYYNKDGKRNQITFDVVRAMYDYANKSPIYLNDGTYSSTGVPLAVTDNSFMFRENHTDRFVVSVSDVAKLSKLTLNMKSLNGGSLEITDISAALVLEAGALQINEQEEYARTGATEYLCSDSVDKVPAFSLFLPTGRNIYQEVYFGDHEPIKLDTENNTWVSAVSRVPNSQNDTVNVYVYPADDADGSFAIDARVQYTDVNGKLLETGATGLTKGTNAEGKTVYSVQGLGASGMSTLNKVYIKAQSPDVVDAYIDHVIVQQIRAGVVINTFCLDCEHRNADMEFYAYPGTQQFTTGEEQKVYLALGSETEAANLVPENRDVAVALRYTSTNDTSDQVYTSKYIYITDQQYQSIQAGDLITLTFNESYVREIKGILVSATGNVKAHVDMACVDNYQIDSETGEKTLLGHFSFATGAIAQNNIVLLSPEEETAVQLLQVEFVTAAADTYLESGTAAPIAMAIGYTDSQGVSREQLIPNIRDSVISSGEPFSTGSTTLIQLLLRDAVEIRWLQLMPYDQDPGTTAGWKLGQITVLLGTEGFLQKATRTVDTYITEDVQLDWEGAVTVSMLGGHRVSFVNIIVKADVKAENASGQYGNSYHINSADNQSISVGTVSEGSVLITNIDVTNSEEGYWVKVERLVGQAVAEDVSSLLIYGYEEVIFTAPKNEVAYDAQGSNMIYKITVSSKEQEDMKIEIEVVIPPVVLPQPEETTTPEPDDTGDGNTDDETAEGGTTDGEDTGGEDTGDGTADSEDTGGEDTGDGAADSENTDSEAADGTGTDSSADDEASADVAASEENATP